MVNACSTTTPCGDSNKIPTPHHVLLDGLLTNKVQGNSSCRLSFSVGVFLAMKLAKD